MPTPSRRTRLARIAIAALVVAAIGAGASLMVAELASDDDSAPAPIIAVTEETSEAAEEELGFPAFATKNTTRVGGDDATADAAGVALATFPSTGGVDGPAAVTLVPSSDWAAGIAASVLVGEPVRAPILLSDPDGVPEQTETAIDALDPRGSGATQEAQIVRIGDVATPGDLRTTEVPAGDAAQIANAVDRLRGRLADRDPQGIVLASAAQPAFAMPAAAWAARSGDPVLFTDEDELPRQTAQALRRHDETPVFVLGPKSVISQKVMREVEDISPAVQRISGDDPVTNAIAFARFEGGGFGWNVVDPGHGLVIANTSRPLDAAAAAPLSASGKWGPLLLTDTADNVPAPLRGYLLDIKPGYRGDPTRAIYNHAWLIGNSTALSVGFQARVDELLELVPIEPGAGTRVPGEPEQEQPQ